MTPSCAPVGGINQQVVNTHVTFVHLGTSVTTVMEWLRSMTPFFAHLGSTVHQVMILIFTPYDHAYID